MWSCRFVKTLFSESFAAKFPIPCGVAAKIVITPCVGENQNSVWSLKIIKNVKLLAFVQNNKCKLHIM